MPEELVKASVYCVLGSASAVGWNTILAVVLAVVVVVIIIVIVVVVVLTRRRFRSSRFYIYRYQTS